MNQAGRTETVGVAASEDTSYQFARFEDLDICSHKGVELDGRVVVNELKGGGVGMVQVMK
jgi:hypothetical protein